MPERKKNSIFAAVSDQGTDYIKFATGIFMSICLLLSAKIQGCSNPVFLLHLCNGSLVGNREANSLLYFKYFNFS